MHDLGLVAFDEPFANLLTQGMVLNEIMFRKTETGRIVYFNPADVDIQTDEQGRRIGALLRADGQPVVISEQELLPQRQAAEPESQPRLIMPWLLLGLAFAILIVAFARRAPRALAACASLFWLLCGCVGLVLALSWAFTDHRALWANRNLMLVNPLCLLLLPGGFALLRGRMPTARFRLLLKIVLAIAALACVPLWLQALPQRNGPWLALLLPIHTAFAWAWANTRRTSA